MQLTPVQVRILGCLLEKERTTPEDYPLTVNAIVRAANQTTSRWPVMQLDAGEVERELVEMKDLGLVRFVHSTSNRARKHRHVLDEAWGCSPEELALLALLALRGPQTIGELKARSERLATFAGLESVRRLLEALASRPEPLVRELPREPGRKETRWAHLLGDAQDLPEAPADASAGTAPAATGLAARVAALEAEVADLRARLDALAPAVRPDL